ncbi:MAG: glycine cleavage system aminomethyltransferase GcvT [Candidatus Methylacidiphilales bacterium]
MASKTQESKSPFHLCHEKLEARMISFSGWLMPVYYQGIQAEHHAVRKHVGVFDISHMGIFTVTGAKAESGLNTLLTNDVRTIAIGEGQYTLMLNERGGVIDDLILYRLTEQKFMLVVNASQSSKDWSWLQEHLPQGVAMENIGESMAALAVQGPLSEHLIEKVFPQQSILPRRNRITYWEESNPPLWIARTGYTGEDGFELFFTAEAATQVWDMLMKRLPALDGLPAGLGARDTLRLEAGLPLNGNDLSPEINPLEAGLRSFVSFDKPEKFIGSHVLRKTLEQGVERKLMAFVMDGKTPPPRHDYELQIDGKVVGKVTSGAITPTLDQGIGLALVPTSVAQPEQSFTMDIRGKSYSGRLKKKPLYKRNA